MGYSTQLILATLGVIITEAAVWLMFYLAYCYNKKRLPFGKLRVLCFRFLMQRTVSPQWRIRWATLLFGREGRFAAKCAVCLERLDTKLKSTGNVTPLTDRIAERRATMLPDEVA